VQRVFGATLHDFQAPTGERFHAPLNAPSIPAELQPTVAGLTGLEDWTQSHVSAISSPHGVSPSDMEAFYDMKGVRGSGIDGSGMTVVLPEIDNFTTADLSAYASKYGLPPFNVEVHRNAAWGDPKGIQGEANMDLEIVHAFAPAAKLVVYYSSPKNSQVLPMLQALFSEQAGPNTIVSSSIGTCESPDAKASAQAEENIVHAAAGKGTSIFVASGDRGAYDCLPQGDPDTLASDLDGGLPDITSVGGTTVFLGQNSGYFKEAAWGQPVEQWGGNGGLSIFWNRPSWQVAPGVDNQFSNGMRQTPDVSANADSQSGWNVISDGAEHKIGGTSAAAPMWSAITALFDQVLIQQHHQTIGFANPGLYWMAQNPSSLPAPPFHDVTIGNNLYYPATAGWDFASGLGSPDVGALAVDWPKYQESQGR
jgi:kumamolisin